MKYSFSWGADLRHLHRFKIQLLFLNVFGTTKYITKCLPGLSNVTPVPVSTLHCETFELNSHHSAFTEIPPTVEALLHLMPLLGGGGSTL